jgi:hypothetical protein
LGVDAGGNVLGERKVIPFPVGIVRGRSWRPPWVEPGEMIGIVLLLAYLAFANPAPAVAGAGGCLGDCGNDGVVTVDEVIRMVSVALGSVPLAACPLPDRPAAIPNVSDLIGAVNNLLDGCPPRAPTPTSTVIVEDEALIPGRLLRIEFSTSPPFIESLPNTLYAFLGDANRVEEYGSMIGALYDGDVLLGVSTSSVGCCASGSYSFHPAPVSWESPTSPWDHPTGDPAVVDFATLHDGSIDGRIDIAIDAGRLELELGDVALVFIHATFANGGSTIPPAPILRSVRIIGGLPVDATPTATPEPAGSSGPTSTPSPTVRLGDDDD